MNDIVPNGETLDAHRAAVFRAGLRAFSEASRGGVSEEELPQLIESAGRNYRHEEPVPTKGWWRILGMW